MKGRKVLKVVIKRIKRYEKSEGCKPRCLVVSVKEFGALVKYYDADDLSTIFIRSVQMIPFRDYVIEEILNSILSIR